MEGDKKDDIESLVETIRRPETGLIKDRKWMFRTYPKCFVGSDLVDWLVKRKHCSTREEAVSLGQNLLALKIIQHVTKDHQFKDENLFYRFREDDDRRLDFKDRVIKKLGDIDSEAAEDLASWTHIYTINETSSSSSSSSSSLSAAPEEARFQPEIKGFADEGMADVLAQLDLSPLDEHNLKLLDNVHPPNYVDPEESDGHYNMVVIGAGAGGLVTACGSAGVGARVAIIEKHLLGGDCLNYGCVPSKALLSCARTASAIKHSQDFFIKVHGEVEIDFAGIMERMRKLRAEISPNDSVKRLEDEYGIHVFFGSAKFTGPNTIMVNDKVLKFRKACIASGGRPAVPNIPGLLEANPLTNISVFNLTELPKRLIVIGSGAIGCELSQAFALFGSEVHIIERGERILNREEEEAAKIVSESLARDGVNFHLKTRCVRVEVRGSEKVLIIADENDKESELVADQILVAVGRKPNVTKMGLKAAGIDYDQRKGVFINDMLQTSNKNVFAVGDCCSKYKFTHVADFMARIVIRNALFFGKARFTSLVLPWCTYTKPEVAHVGLYESDLKGTKCSVYQKHFKDLDRAILDGETNGYIKVIVKEGTDQILGCTIVASNAGDMISEVTLAMTNHIGMAGISVTIHPYPTQADVIRHTADMYNRTRLTPVVRSLFRKLMAARR